LPASISAALASYSLASRNSACRFSSLAGCEFQAPQKCLRLIKVYAINFIP
jgi:hypothetical protein